MENTVERLKLSPEEFELEIKRQFDCMSRGLKNYKSTHRELIPGPDGEYEIDIVASFESLGLNFKTLIECKNYKRKVEREVLLALHTKKESLGAQKAVLVTTVGFQTGALEFAKSHGIAAMVFKNWRLERILNSKDLPGIQYGPLIPTLILTTFVESKRESIQERYLNERSSIESIFET
jgi:hypothetical protein